MENLREQNKKQSTQYPIRIALIGKQRTGKSTVAKYLSEKYDFFEKPLAAPIYDIARDYFGMGEKDRQLLINIGESMRKIDRDVWLKYMWKHSNNIPRVVVSDVRMKHEYEYLKRRSFIFLKIHADYNIRSSREGYDISSEDSRTETQVNEIPYDFKIWNVSTLSYLHSQLDHFMESLI